MDLELDPNLTIIVGRNGAGKTTILDAISTSLKFVSNIWRDEKGERRANFPSILDADKRFGEDDYKIRLDFELGDKDFENAPTYVEIEPKDSSSGTRKSVMTILNYAQAHVKSNKDQPLFIYYHQNRGFENSRHVEKSSSRQQVLDQSLDGDLKAITDLESWWDKRDAQEARTVRDHDLKYRDPQLEAIRKLVKAIDSFKDVSFNSTSSPPGLYFKSNDNSLVHVSKLSTGERSYIILLADLARRLQIVSPELNLEEISGIVLIDEIELNLHPAWQGVVIESLTKVFKKCQFVITTHSPQIVSSSESKHVRIISKNEDGAVSVEIPLNTKGRSSNYLLEGVFGSSERYPPIDKLIDDFDHAIHRRDFFLASEILERIEKGIEGNPPEMLVFKKRLNKIKDEK